MYKDKDNYPMRPGMLVSKKGLRGLVMAFRENGVVRIIDKDFKTRWAYARELRVRKWPWPPRPFPRTEREAKWTHWRERVLEMAERHAA